MRTKSLLLLLAGIALSACQVSSKSDRPFRPPTVAELVGIINSTWGAKKDFIVQNDLDLDMASVTLETMVTKTA